MKRISSALSRRGFSYVAPLLLVLLGLAAKAGLAQDGIGHVEYDWTEVFSGSGSVVATSAATDAAGDVYLAGYFSGTFDFDPGDGVDSETASDALSSFVTRINADGSYGWTRIFAIPFAFLEPRHRVVADPAGNVYLSANFYGSIDADPGTAVRSLASAGRFDGVVIKLSDSGEFVWVRTIGGPWSDYIHDLAIGPSGRALYVTGSFQRRAQFDSVQGSDKKVAAARSDAFITRLGTDGSYGWTRTLGGAYEGASFVSTADDDAVYLAGTLASETDLDDEHGDDRPLQAARILLRKYSAAGSAVWTREINASRRDAVTSMAIRPERGQLFLLGTFSSSVDFDPGSAVDIHSAAGLNDVFVSRFDTDGSYAWTRTLNMGLFSAARGIAVGAEGAYVAGGFHGDVDFDPGPGEDIRSATNVFVNDIFLLSLRDDGGYGGVDIFAWQGGAKSLGSGTPVSDARGNVYVTGQFAGTVDFDPTPAVDDKTSPDKRYSLFLAKLAADVVPPEISLTTPPDGYVTGAADQTLIGAVSEPAVLTVNGVPAPLDASNRFHFPLTLVEGDNAVALTAADAAGNIGSISVHFSLDTLAPGAVEPGLTTLSDIADGGIVVSGAAGSAEGGTQVYITNARTGEIVVVTASSAGSFAAFLAAQAGDTISIRLQDAAGNSSASIDFSVAESGPPLPPDPAIVAPPVDPTVATTVFSATQFLYTGASPIQTGVVPGTIDLKRAAVLRGRVVSRDGNPLSGVTVSVHQHPEFGQTLSRADGMFDLAVNGGGYLTLSYQRDGNLPVQRQVNVPWQDYAWLPDVVMIPVDTQVTAIAANSSSTQVAQGNMVTDDDGVRRTTMLFPAGTQADMVLPDGSTRALTTFNVRATEYTQGSNGQNAMPGELPPTSGYTYAVELSVDEAMAAGAASVNFNQPIPVYVENFLDFPVGSPVPAGYYDRQKGAWMPSTNGRVIEILGVTGGLADLAIADGGSIATASDLAALNITDAERARLAALYAVGKTLWRVQVMHFTPWDFNWPFGPPNDATGPNQPSPVAQENEQDDPDCQGGSIIECQNQILGERIRINGTPFSLNYRSDRVPGRTIGGSLKISLTGPSVPASLKYVTLTVAVAGKKFEANFPALPDQRYNYVWDGRDCYGRDLVGRQIAKVSIGYVYDGVYLDARPGPEYDVIFGHFSYYGLPVTGDRARGEVTLWQYTEVPTSARGSTEIGEIDQRPLGLGGWSLDILHRYDPVGKVLWLGDGTRRSASAIGSEVMTTAAGSGLRGYAGDGGPASAARLAQPMDVAVAPDGSILIADSRNNRIRRVGPDGVIATVAGTGVHGFGGDGGPAGAAQLAMPMSVAVAPDGAILIAEYDNNRIRRVDPDGVISTVGGTGAAGHLQDDGVLAVEAQIDRPTAVATAPDGSILFADASLRIRRIDPDGVIRTIAGNGTSGLGGDGGMALAAPLFVVQGLAVAPDGSVLLSEVYPRVRRISPDGIITTLAGTGVAGDAGDGGSAVAAQLFHPAGLAVAPDGGVVIADSIYIRYVGPDGTITNLAGRSNHAEGTPGSDGGPASAIDLLSPHGVAVAPDGAVLFSDSSDDRIRRVGPALSGVQPGNYILPSDDAAQIYVLDNRGRHLRTLSARTGAVQYEFTYDDAGRLTQVTDGDGNATRIVRTSDTSEAIIAPDGQSTALAIDGDGYLASMTNPAGETIHLSYNAGGLLTQYQDARGNRTNMEYDAVGRLRKETRADGGGWELSRSETDAGWTVTMNSALGRTHGYLIEELSNGDQRRTNAAPDGATSKKLIVQSGITTTSDADGTVTTITPDADPRFGMLAPVVKNLKITTPSGHNYSAATTRLAVLATASDPLSLTQLTERTSVNGRLSISVLNAPAHQLTFISPVGRQRVLTMDSLARPLNVQVTGISNIHYGYDARGRLSSVQQGTGPDARSLSLAYDPQGNVESVTDALTRTEGFRYDLAGRIIQQTLPDGRIIGYTYDANGNITSITPPGRSAHTFTYTAVDQNDSYTPPALPGGATVTDYAYNADQQLTRITRPDDQAIVFNYGPATGRLDSISVPEGTIAMAYDPATRRLSGISTPSGDTLTYSYDGFLPLSETWTGAVAGTVSRTYDNNFDVSGVAVNGSAIGYGYDDDGLLTQAGAETLTRDTRNGLLTGTSLGGLTTTLGYDGFAELSGASASYGAGVLYDATYTHDRGGRITQKIETIAGVAAAYDYTYDSAGRLSEVREDGVAVASYTYDSNGNRIGGFDRRGPITATVDAQDRLTDYNGAVYTYTANGELLSKTDTSGSTSYVYDVLGNLRHVTLPDGTAIDYVIDGRNRRIGKKVNGTLVQGLLYEDQLNPVAELDGSGAVVARFIYGSKLNVPDYMIKGGNTYRIISDHLGSTRLIVNVADGTVAQRLDYDEFGYVLKDTSPGFQPFGFAGGLYDRATKLTRFGARDYDAATGRWSLKDPVGFLGGAPNLYEYAISNPVSFLDPEGTAAYFVRVAQNLKDTNASLEGRGARTLTNFLAGRKVASIMDEAVGGSIYKGLSVGSKIGVFIGRSVAIGSKLTLIWESGAAAGSMVNAMQVPGSEGTVREWWADWFYDTGAFWDSPGSWLYDYIHGGGNCH